MYHVTYHFDDGRAELDGEFLILDHADYAEACDCFNSAVNDPAETDQPKVSVMLSDDTGYVFDFFAFIEDPSLCDEQNDYTDPRD